MTGHSRASSVPGGGCVAGPAGQILQLLFGQALHSRPQAGAPHESLSAVNRQNHAQGEPVPERSAKDLRIPQIGQFSLSLPLHGKRQQSLRQSSVPSHAQVVRVATISRGRQTAETREAPFALRHDVCSDDSPRPAITVQSVQMGRIGKTGAIRKACGSPVFVFFRSFGTDRLTVSWSQVRRSFSQVACPQRWSGEWCEQALPGEVLPRWAARHCGCHGLIAAERRKRACRGRKTEPDPRAAGRRGAL